MQENLQIEIFQLKLLWVLQLKLLWVFDSSIDRESYEAPRCSRSLEVPTYKWNHKSKDKGSQNVKVTCRCRCSSRNFSEFAISYSPFSKYRWSGLNLESVGGNFSWVFTNKFQLMSRKIPKSWQTNTHTQQYAQWEDGAICSIFSEFLATFKWSILHLCKPTPT